MPSKVIENRLPAIALLFDGMRLFGIERDAHMGTVGYLFEFDAG